MRRISLLLTFIFLAAIPFGAFAQTWTLRGSAPLSTGLSGMAIGGDGTLYFACMGNGFYKSINRGQTWTQVSDRYVRGLAIDSTGTLWGIDNGSTRLVYSEDGGETWNTTNYFPNYPNNIAYAVMVSSDDKIWAAGYDKDSDPNYLRVYRSPDGGNTWVTQDTFPYSTTIGQFLFETDSNTLLLCTNPNYTYYGRVFRSTNQGINWSQTFYFSGDNGSNPITLAQDNTGAVFLAQRYDIWKSVDDGASWFNLPNTPEGVYVYYDIETDLDGNLYVPGYSTGQYVIYRTTDSGATWETPAALENAGTIYYIETGPDGSVFAVAYGAHPSYYYKTYEFCDGCYIGGVCYAATEINPSNPCEFCDPAYSKTNWNNRDGLACDDGQYCNGDDTCVASACTTHAGNPCADDGLWCNGQQICDEGSDQCFNINIPDCPDDGLWCNGDEVCDEVADQCGHTGTPCPDDAVYCNGDEGCDDATDECTHTGDPCQQDGVFCNGVEVCDAEEDQCISPGDPCTDDGLYCNGNDWCDEDFDECMHEYDESNPLCPDDGIYCNGDEICDEQGDQCGSSGDPCEDDGEFCNGDEVCDEEAAECINSGDPCEEDETCNEDIDECLTADDDTADDDTVDDDTSDDDTADDDTVDDDTADDDADDDDVDADDDTEDEHADGDDDDDSTGSGCGC